MTFLLYHIMAYRKKVVLENLDIAFPNKSRATKLQIAKQFYRNFCDIFLEGLKGFSLSKSEIMERYTFYNTQALNTYFEQEQSVILIGSHYANWEWGVLSVSLWLKHTIIGIYKPIKNQWVDQYLMTSRKKWGLELAKMKDTGRAVIRNRDRQIAYVLIADQSPSDLINAHWVNFFGVQTPFLHGTDKIAKMTGYPVFVFDIKRIKRGYYEVYFNPLIKNPKQVKKTEVTLAFARHLESYIQKHPENWLWSHRRWKRSTAIKGSKTKWLRSILSKDPFP